ncbi:unnamed protein product [Ilex paraguariensis]|uniref:RNase H type-1 domain-containing protein n=1 Tax=Ilex paraguariensis TaxID=185542 RepID=A0ABC8TGE2_9AQUA
MQIVSSLKLQAFVVRPKRADDARGKELLSDLQIVPNFVVETKALWGRWEVPPVGVLKLNVDGASKGSTFFGMGSNMQAECYALLDGLKMILRHSLEGYRILIESDSQALVDMEERKVGVPWKYQKVMDQIWRTASSEVTSHEEEFQLLINISSDARRNRLLINLQNSD